MCDTGGRTKLVELTDPPETIEDLPSPDTKRWVIRRKAVVVYAVEEGIISLEDACKRYSISLEDFESWRRLIERHGIGGLRVTRLAQYRTPPDADAC